MSGIKKLPLLRVHFPTALITTRTFPVLSPSCDHSSFTRKYRVPDIGAWKLVPVPMGWIGMGWGELPEPVLGRIMATSIPNGRLLK